MVRLRLALCILLFYDLLTFLLLILIVSLEICELLDPLLNLLLSLSDLFLLLDLSSILLSVFALEHVDYGLRELHMYDGHVRSLLRSLA